MTLSIHTESLITDILAVVDSITAEFVEAGFKAVSGYWLTSGLMTSVLALYVIVFLYQVKDQDIPISETTKQLIKVCFVYALMMNWDVFFILVYNVATNEPVVIASKLAGDMNGGAALDNVVAKGFKQAAQMLSNAPFSLKGLALAWSGASLTVIATILFVIVGISLIIISKFYLAVYLAIAPYFIACTLFDASKGLTEAYVKAVINKMLVPVFVGCVLLLGIKLADACLGAGQSSPDTQIDLVNILVYLFCSILTFLLFAVIPEIAASLTASLSIASAARVASQAKNLASGVQSAYGRGKKAVGAAKDGFKQRNQSMMKDIQERAADRSQKETAAREARRKMPY